MYYFSSLSVNDGKELVICFKLLTNIFSKREMRVIAYIYNSGRITLTLKCCLEPYLLIFIRIVLFIIIISSLTLWYYDHINCLCGDTIVFVTINNISIMLTGPGLVLMIFDNVIDTRVEDWSHHVIDQNQCHHHQHHG